MNVHLNKKCHTEIDILIYEFNEILDKIFYDYFLLNNFKAISFYYIQQIGK